MDRHTHIHTRTQVTVSLALEELRKPTSPYISKPKYQLETIMLNIVLYI